MSLLSARVEEINQLFLKDHIKVDVEWLHGCVEWFISESLNITNNTLYKQAQQQWQLSNIKESSMIRLPNTILNTTPYTLEGHHPVQLQFLLDISESPYDQLRKLYNKQLDEGEDEVRRRQQQPIQTNKKRVLKLELTDGDKNFSAMEYSPIPCLNTKLSPGCKILLIGPMRCVNKIIFLEKKNVQILGGEVDDIIIQNAYENVLLRMLNKPINPNPKLDYTEATVSESTAIPFIPAPRSQPQPSSIIPQQQQQQSLIYDNFTDDDIEVDDILCNAVNMIEENHRQASQHINENTNQGFFEDDDDDDLLLAETEIPISDLPNPQISTNNEDGDNIADDDIPNANVDENQIESTSQRQSNNDIDEQVQQLSSTFQNISQSSGILSPNYKFKIRGINLATIDQLTEIDDADKDNKFFIVKAKLSESIFEKLQIRKNLWTFGAYLENDESTSNLKIRFNDAVLNSLFDYSAKEMVDMRKMIARKPAMQEEIQQIIDDMKQILTDLHCYMKISFSSNTSIPIVIECIKSASVLDRIWANKLATEKIS